MPKSIYIPDKNAREGIVITYTPSSNTLYISGWYDSCVGIEGHKYELNKFLSELGISDENIAKTMSKVIVSGYTRKKSWRTKKTQMF